MTFGQAIQSYFKNYANFNGRARRSEYWFASLFVGLVSIAFSLVGSGYDYNTGMPTYGPLTYIWALAVLLPSLAVAVRRLHDIGKSGATYLLILIPFVGAIILFVFALQDSQPVANQYGAPVK